MYIFKLRNFTYYFDIVVLEGNDVDLKEKMLLDRFEEFKLKYPALKFGEKRFINSKDIALRVEILNLNEYPELVEKADRDAGII